MGGSKAIRRLLRGENCGQLTSRGNVCLATRMAPGQPCRRCAGYPEAKQFATVTGIPGLPDRSGRNANSMPTALWHLAAGVMDPQAKQILLTISQMKPDLHDHILIMQTQLLSVIARHGRGEISQESYDKAVLDLSEQIRKLFESQAKVRIADADLAKHNPDAFGDDALDPEKLNE